MKPTPRARAIIISWTAMFAIVGAAVHYTNEVSIGESNGYRTITSNGIPDHKAGDFPNRHNPNTMTPQDYHYRVALNPQSSAKPTKVGMNAFGVALNGVPFDPAAAQWFNNDPRSGWQYEAKSGFVDLGLDFNNAHVQPNGAYHYHGIPTGLVGTSSNEMILVGYAADGYPMYAKYGYVDANDPQSAVVELKSSYRLKHGTRPNGPGGTYDGEFVEDWEYVPGLGDLDECNGRSGVTPEYPDGTYYYVLTEGFPFIPRLWRGTPDPSFFKHGPGPGGRGRGGAPPFPPPPGFGPPPPGYGPPPPGTGPPPPPF